jgi:hypothetical protein
MAAHRSPPISPIRSRSTGKSRWSTLLKARAAGRLGIRAISGRSATVARPRAELTASATPNSPICREPPDLACANRGSRHWVPCLRVAIGVLAPPPGSRPIGAETVLLFSFWPPLAATLPQAAGSVAIGPEKPTSRLFPCQNQKCLLPWPMKGSSPRRRTDERRPRRKKSI